MFLLTNTSVKEDFSLLRSHTILRRNLSSRLSGYVGNVQKLRKGVDVVRMRCKLCKIIQTYLSDSERDLVNGYLYGDYSSYFIASYIEKTLRIEDIDHMTIERHRSECMGLNIPKSEKKEEKLEDYIVVKRRNSSKSSNWDSSRERNDEFLSQI